MEGITCQHQDETCSAKCSTKADFYIDDKELYVCNNHHRAWYRNDDCTKLTDFSKVRTIIEVFGILMKKFEGYLLAQEESEEAQDLLIRTSRSKIIMNGLNLQLNEAKRKTKYYKYDSIFKKIKTIKNEITSYSLYSEFSKSDSWNNSFLKVNRKHKKSINLDDIGQEDSGSSTEEDNHKLRKNTPELTRISDKKAKRFLEESLELPPLRTSTTIYNKTKGHKDRRVQSKDLSKKEPKEESKEDRNYHPKKRELKRISLQREEDREGYQKEQIFTKSKRQKRQDATCSCKQEDPKAVEKRNQIEKEHEQCKQQNQALTNEVANIKRQNADLLKKYERDMQKEKEKNDKLAQQLKDMKDTHERMKQSLISNLDLSKHSDFSLLYKITTGEDKQIGPETTLILKLDNPKHMKFLISLNKRMPDIDRLDLYNIPLNCQEVKTFLATHFPNKVRLLYFNYLSRLSSCVPFYLEELVEVSKRVTGVLFIYKFEVSQDQLVALFSASRHKQWFGLPYCKLSLSSVPDFGGTLAGSTIQGLNLRSCGDSSYGDWDNNESHFENLIAGLSKEEDFRKNLEGIGMFACGMEKNVVKKILADHGFGHVEIDD
ncbi:unnamed protein product [Moneuplotes crassus]|uniref:Uncharacterized protein n=1 Tax=Euplotes crassus TaxID=5936 RepID=A0AAD1X7I6_EUPCR|nr:unnamed protein product [Moneuplotes crassus]